MLTTNCSSELNLSEAVGMRYRGRSGRASAPKPNLTNYGTKPFLMVAPPLSEHFATCVENEVGPFDVVDTLAEGDVVRRAIFHLFNNGSPYVGYVALAHLLFSDHDNWDMGATFES